MQQQKTHWKKLTNPDYLGTYAFDVGVDKVLTVKSVANEVVTGADGKKETCVVMRFTEPEKPFILNTTNSKTIQKIYHTPYIEEWSGKKVQLFVQNDVKAFGEVVDAVRIRPYVPKDSPTCEDCGQDIKPASGRTALYLAQYTKGKYGRCLCASCATKANAAPQKAEEPTPEQVDLNDPTE